MKRAIWVWTLGVLVLLSFGPGSGEAFGHDAMARGWVGSTETFNRGTFLAPAPSDIEPTVSQDRAWAIGLGHNLGAYRSARVEYGLFTDRNSYSIINGTRLPPDNLRRPAWVVTFTDECVDILGYRPPSYATLPCTSDFHVVVDAHTGRFIMSFAP
jgi:hypothetical protein